ncbi:hypothetical protein VM98_36080, partial [Streptomyces rubellomurinus subsp. indigoferus]
MFPGAGGGGVAEPHATACRVTAEHDPIPRHTAHAAAEAAPAAKQVDALLDTAGDETMAHATARVAPLAALPHA